MLNPSQSKAYKYNMRILILISKATECAMNEGLNLLNEEIHLLFTNNRVFLINSFDPSHFIRFFSLNF